MPEVLQYFSSTSISSLSTVTQRLRILFADSVNLFSSMKLFLNANHACLIPSKVEASQMEVASFLS